MKKKKRLQPILPPSLEETLLSLEDEATVVDAYVENQQIDDADFHHLFMKECHFKKLQMTASHLRQFECVNVIFEGCDFSNSDWIGAGFHQVEFRQCKLTGTNFAESFLKDCLFVDCMLDYASFAAATMKVVHFEESSIRQSDFSELDWQSLHLSACNLSQSQWFHTRLKELDFSQNEFEAIALSAENMRGLIVNAEQALTIAGTLGLVVK